jgi:hypothetical protein
LYPSERDENLPLDKWGRKVSRTHKVTAFACHLSFLTLLPRILVLLSANIEESKSLNMRLGWNPVPNGTESDESGTPIRLEQMAQQREVREPDDDWTGLKDPKARRKLQNRLNARIWRKSILSSHSILEF